MGSRATSSHTVLDLLRLTTTYFAERGVDTPRLDAEVLLAHVLGMDRVGLYVNFDRPLQTNEVDAYRESVRRRARREPVAYIIGEKEFMGRSFTVTPDVLIPRPETELLVEAVLHEYVDEHQSAQPQPDQEGESALQGLDTADKAEARTAPPLRFCDVGTGSGVIAVMLALSQPQAHITAVDVMPAALAIAEANAVRHGVAERIDFYTSDLFAQLTPGALFDCIVSNPPYIPQAVLPSLAPEVQKEPQVALAAGPDGLQVIRALMAQAPARLKPGGLLALEIGADQGKAVATLGDDYGYAGVEIRPDYAGRDRVALLRTQGESEA
ncbi:MAG TPA: peptide chain release factor N(5)-glutamine methyltransferase [Firmicutes bacterium]|nr:peptide chain release factor N(5)-glutamine methyltransferase [Bacillota bacterium]